MRFMIRISLAVILTLSLAISAGAQEKEHNITVETSRSIPVLSDFHEVIYPLWHEAWPNKDYNLIRDLLPKVREYVAQIERAELPGILRDKVEKWHTGLEALREAADRYNATVESNDEPGMLKAIEDLHSRYEKLVRILRPVMPQLEDYHVVLYGIYHHSAPDKNLEELRAATVELAKKSEILSNAEAPKRLAAKADAFKKDVTELHACTLDLRAVAEKDDWKAINAAVERVHTSYQKVEGLFE